METVVRVIAIIVEVAILAGITYAVLYGVNLAIFDLGVNAKYKKGITLALLTVGILVVVFFISHLTTFYPPRLE